MAARRTSPRAWSPRSPRCRWTRAGWVASPRAPRRACPTPRWQRRRLFARQLGGQGITVTGAPVPATAPRAAAELAAVSSPALSDLLGWMLSTSDNDLAEALAHLVAHASGEPADFPGGVTAVTNAVEALGLPVQDLQLYDGSGLSTQTRVDPGAAGAAAGARGLRRPPRAAPAADRARGRRLHRQPGAAALRGDLDAVGRGAGPGQDRDADRGLRAGRHRRGRRAGA